jgi:hypothetical protein
MIAVHSMVPAEKVVPWHDGCVPASVYPASQVSAQDPPSGSGAPFEQLLPSAPPAGALMPSTVHPVAGGGGGGVAGGAGGADI